MEKDKIANPYVMPVVLNGKKFKCLVDTGSACTIIRKSVATKLEVVPKQEHTLLRSFDGSYVASTGDVELEVRVGQPQAVIRGTVVDDENIKVTTQEPVVCNPYRMSPHEKEILRGIVDDLLVNGIIRESTSEYASSVLLVKKKTGDYRMCVDYRRLNAITVKDKYPLPLVADQLDRLGGDGKGGKFKYFTALDMFSGFYQVSVGKDSVAKTAFITPDGHTL